MQFSLLFGGQTDESILFGVILIDLQPAEPPCAVPGLIDAKSLRCHV